jgi:hypothetical protein
MRVFHLHASESAVVGFDEMGNVIQQGTPPASAIAELESVFRGEAPWTRLPPGSMGVTPRGELGRLRTARPRCRMWPSVTRIWQTLGSKGRTIHEDSALRPAPQTFWPIGQWYPSPGYRVAKVAWASPTPLDVSIAPNLERDLWHPVMLNARMDPPDWKPLVHLFVWEEPTPLPHDA